jgi:hypothetical protein
MSYNLHLKSSHFNLGTPKWKKYILNYIKETKPKNTALNENVEQGDLIESCNWLQNYRL